MSFNFSNRENINKWYSKIKINDIIDYDSNGECLSRLTVLLARLKFHLNLLERYKASLEDTNKWVKYWQNKKEFFLRSTGQYQKKITSHRTLKKEKNYITQCQDIIKGFENIVKENLISIKELQADINQSTQGLSNYLTGPSKNYTGEVIKKIVYILTTYDNKIKGNIDPKNIYFKEANRITKTFLNIDFADKHSDGDDNETKSQNNNKLSISNNSSIIFDNHQTRSNSKLTNSLKKSVDSNLIIWKSIYNYLKKTKKFMMYGVVAKIITDILKKYKFIISWDLLSSKMIDESLSSSDKKVKVEAFIKMVKTGIYNNQYKNLSDIEHIALFLYFVLSNSGNTGYCTGESNTGYWIHMLNFLLIKKKIEGAEIKDIKGCIDSIENNIFGYIRLSDDQSRLLAEAHQEFSLAFQQANHDDNNNHNTSCKLSF